MEDSGQDEGAMAEMTAELQRLRLAVWAAAADGGGDGDGDGDGGAAAGGDGAASERRALESERAHLLDYTQLLQERLAEGRRPVGRCGRRGRKLRARVKTLDEEAPRAASCAPRPRARAARRPPACSNGPRKRASRSRTPPPAPRRRAAAACARRLRGGGRAAAEQADGGDRRPRRADERGAAAAARRRRPRADAPGETRRRQCRPLAWSPTREADGELGAARRPEPRALRVLRAAGGRVGDGARRARGGPRRGEARRDRVAMRELVGQNAALKESCGGGRAKGRTAPAGGAAHRPPPPSAYGARRGATPQTAVAGSLRGDARLAAAEHAMLLGCLLAALPPMAAWGDGALGRRRRGQRRRRRWRDDEGAVAGGCSAAEGTAGGVDGVRASSERAMRRAARDDQQAVTAATTKAAVRGSAASCNRPAAR